MPTELDKFRALIFSILSQDKPVWIRCDSERAAKQLRRRLYRLRDHLDPLEKQQAANINFLVANHRVLCQAPHQKQRAAPDKSWPDRVHIGVDPDAS